MSGAGAISWSTWRQARHADRRRGRTRQRFHRHRPPRRRQADVGQRRRGHLLA
ncbi:putative lipoprotein lppL [Mycobacterium xenopi 3993]|nr:putative lipoprotein lppL [Mycobacterium xenopi 3993]